VGGPAPGGFLLTRRSLLTFTELAPPPQSAALGQDRCCYCDRLLAHFPVEPLLPQFAVTKKTRVRSRGRQFNYEIEPVRPLVTGWTAYGPDAASYSLHCTENPTLGQHRTAPLLNTPVLSRSAAIGPAMASALLFCQMHSDPASTLFQPEVSRWQNAIVSHSDPDIVEILCRYGNSVRCTSGGSF
jgi:hypothetical protein